MSDRERPKKKDGSTKEVGTGEKAGGRPPVKIQPVGKKKGEEKGHLEGREEWFRRRSSGDGKTS